MRGLIRCAVVAALAGVVWVALADPPISTGDKYRDQTIEFKMLDSLIQGLGPSGLSSDSTDYFLRSTSPTNTVLFGATKAASAWDTLVVTNYNEVSITWSAAPTIILQGTGIGGGAGAGRDTLTTAILAIIAAAGTYHSVFADIDTMIVGGNAAGFTYGGEAKNW